METAAEYLRKLDDYVWGPGMLALLLGTGVILLLRMRFLPIKNLGWALRCALGRKNSHSTDCPDREPSEIPAWSPEAVSKRTGTSIADTGAHTAAKDQISPFAAFMTELATTIGTGNIVGVATAMVLGGPGALVWMLISSFVGLSTKFAESMLSVKYRIRNQEGQFVGGPMYTLQNAFPVKWLGKLLGVLFAVFAVLASFGMGNMTQANSIAAALWETFGVSRALTGLIVTIITILVVLGGISVISRVTTVAVPIMSIFYLAGAVIVIVTHLENLPRGLWMILSMAFSPRAIAGGIGGKIARDNNLASNLTTSGNLIVGAGQAMRWGIARGVFSNEAGLGASGISAAAAGTNDPVRQGYISMTGVFIDTAIVCTVTGLALAASGVLGQTGTDGQLLTGIALTIAAFSTTFGEGGAIFVSIAIVLFAFATIVGWAYQGEKAFEFLTGSPSRCIYYRFFYGFMSFIGAVCSLELVWDFADICNGLMAVPNLICILTLSGEACRAIREYESVRKK